MTNQEAFEAARAGDWIAETFNRVGDVFYVGGSSAGYSSFTDCLSDGQSVFYSAFDSDDSREAGLAVWDASAKTLTPVEIHASLIGAAFIKGDPEPVNFPNGGTITGTLNATAFNTIWRHVFEKGNPHETEASQIDQSNDELGDTIQDALNSLSGQVGSNSDLSQQNKDRLDQEIQDRITADEELWEHVNEVEDQLENLDVSILDDKIDKEVQDRIDGDANLQGQIDDLVVTDGGLQDQIDGLVAAGGGYQSQIDDLVAADTALEEAIESGDAALQGQIDSIVAELGEGGAGAGLVISPTEPPLEDRVEGMQWLDSTTAIVWIWDGAKWLEFPSNAADGEDGADGKDGEDGDSFFTDISSETGNNTIQRFGDEVWVTQFNSGGIFAGTKLGNDIFCSGKVTSGTGTFVGGSIGLQFNSNDDIIPVDDSGNAKVGVDLGTNSTKFMNGRFSGEVSATSLTSSGDVSATSVKLGDWTISVSQGNLKFSHLGVSVMTLTSDGNINTKKDVTAYSGSA